MKGKIEVSIPTSISKTSFNDTEIKLFPNPTKDNFNIKFNSNLEGKLHVRLFSK